MKKNFTKALALLNSQDFDYCIMEMANISSTIRFIIINIQPLNFNNNNYNNISINCTVDTKNNAITLSDSLFFNGDKIYNHHYSPQIKQINKLFQQFLNNNPTFLTHYPNNTTTNKAVFSINI